MRALPMLGVAALAAAVIAVAPPPAAAQDAPTAHIQLETRQAYAELPFNLVVVAEGFDDDPAPEQPSLQIAGATVTPLGVEPRVQQSIQVVNGRRFESRETTWLLRWQVVAARAGNLAVPSILISQGAKKATAEGGAVAITEIATTDDMRLALVLPDRPVWVGETVPVEIDWLLRRQVHDQQLVVPMLSMPDDLLVAAGEASDPKQVLSVAVGASQLELPYDQDQVTVGGTRFTRLRFHVVVTPLRVGALTIAPAQVVASLEVGTGRDRFGFPSARTQLFRAVDEPRTLEVKPLPQQGRPPSFAGAVGTSFSIATQSSRSVVQLGEPVELEITVKGDTRLDGLSLGPLAGPGRLPADRFSMPDTVPPGELSDDGRTKVFKVQVQVTDPSTTEIPPLELAWFDPTAAAYHTAHSEPIALSVKGGTVVGAGDVVGGHRPGAGAGAATGSGGGAAADPGDVSLVGADLALSAPGAATARPLSSTVLWTLIALLYALPLGVLGVRVWQVRTADRREERGEVAAARRRVDAELERARTAAGRDAAGPLVAAMRALARTLGRAGDEPLLARLETEGFAPEAGDHPLPESLRRDAADLVRLWLDDARRGRRGDGTGAGRAGATAAVLLVALTAGAGVARAGAAPVADGRDLYQRALAEPDPGVRQGLFARAEAAFRAAEPDHPDSAELQADLGNAALGAADFGTATLAFRRALRLDAGHERARKNLTWLRGRLPDNLRPHHGGTAATLFFFHAWRRSTRLLVGAAAFAIAVLLLVPWTARRRDGVRLAAVVPGLVWLAMTASLLLEDPRVDDGVVMQAQPLRSADSAGAAPAMAAPLPPGVEVTIVERREGWTKIRTPGGATGWLPDSAVASVAGD